MTTIDPTAAEQAASAPMYKDAAEADPGGRTKPPAGAQAEASATILGSVDGQADTGTVVTPSYPCGVGDCPEVLPSPLRAGRHRLDAHGIRGATAKPKKKARTRVPPPQRPAVERGGAGAPDDGATPKGDSAGVHLPTSPEVHKAKVEATKAFIAGTGNEWLLKSYRWAAPNLPAAAWEKGNAFQIVKPDGTVEKLSLYDIATVSGWQIDVLAEAWVRGEDTPQVKAIKEWVERNGGWLFIGAGLLVVGQHVVGLVQIHNVSTKIAAAQDEIRKQAAAAAEEGRTPEPTALLNDLMANPDAMRAAAQMAEQMGIKIPGMPNGSAPAGEGAEQVA